MITSLSIDSLKLISSDACEAHLRTEFPELSYLDKCSETSPECSGKSSSIEYVRTTASIKAFHALLRKKPAEVCQMMDEREVAELMSFIDDAMPDDETKELMLFWIIIHDLGKSQLLHGLTSNADPSMDHDQRLLYCLKHHPEYFPGFHKHGSSIKERLMHLLSEEAHPVQALQAEGGMNTWHVLASLPPEDLMLHLVLLIVDIAGARGKPFLDAPAWRAISCFIRVLGDMRGMPGEVIRSRYLKNRALYLGVQEQSVYAEIIGSLACLLRCTDRHGGTQIAEIYTSLPEATRCILNEFLSSKNSVVTLLYAPALFVSLGAIMDDFKEAVLAGIHFYCRIYHLGKQYRCAHRQKQALTISLAPLIRSLKKEPHSLDDCALSLQYVNDTVTLQVRKQTRVKRSNTSPLETLCTLSGKNIGLIGIGGGSDCLQAALLGMVLEEHGKTVRFVASIRSAMDGKEERSISNALSEPYKDIFHISKDSQGSGRFLEHLLADRWESYLVLESCETILKEQYQFLVHSLHDIDALFLIDTGGDALFPSQSDVTMNTTPDQDLRALNASTVIHSIPVYSVIVACGVDAPDDAEGRLTMAQAQWYAFSDSEKTKILQQYEQWKQSQQNHMGTDFLGKTPLAFAAALKGAQGYQPLSIPEDYILDEQNPWHPYVYLDGGTSESTMAGCFFMLRDNHINIL